MKRADRDEGLRSDGLTSDEREELARLRRENKRLRMDQEILKEPRSGSPGRVARSPIGIRVREGASGRDGHATPAAAPRQEHALGRRARHASGSGSARRIRENGNPPQPVRGISRCAGGAERAASTLAAS